MSSGGKGSGGRPSGIGGAKALGGSPSVGGFTSVGGASGGLGGDPSTGGDDADGGRGSGGGVTAGGMSNGGGETGGSGDGGKSSGGASSGGSGSGGAGLEGPGPWLIDDLSTGDSYSRSIFGGFWERYIQDGGEWAEVTVIDMIQPRPDDENNPALRVEATALDDWGVDVRVTINGGTDYLDLSPYEGIKISARTNIATENKIRVAIEDSVSNEDTCGTSTSCNKHVDSTLSSGISSSAFTVVTVPFTTVTARPSPRTAAVNLAQVYAIHIKMDPTEEDVDFYIDDVYLY